MATLRRAILNATGKQKKGDRGLMFAKIARDLDNLWITSKQKRRGKRFLYDLQKELLIIEKFLPASLLRKGPTIYDRQQPSLPEAIKETAKRLCLMLDLISNLTNSVLGVICGGSLSYGRFYNIRGQPNPSDLDLLFIVDEKFFLSNNCFALIAGKCGFNRQIVEDFKKRSSAFQQLWAEGKADLMSVKAPTDGFLVSIKIIPLNTFIKEFDAQFKEIIAKGKKQKIGIRDYKQGPYPDKIFTQYNFLHQPLSFQAEEEYPKWGGAITTIPSLIISDGHLYTGQHHNLVMPNLEVELDRSGAITEIISKFRKHLIIRYKKEKSGHKNSDKFQLINCHDRRDIFSPYILEDAKRIETQEGFL